MSAATELNVIGPFGTTRQPAWLRLGSIPLAACLGAFLGLLAWGEARTPALALLLPLLWIAMPSRMAVFALTTAYHLAVIRFLPLFAGTWYESTATGTLMWFLTCILCGMAWAVCWTPSRKTAVVLSRSLLAIVVTMVPPIGSILPGHPIVGMGYMAGGTSWFGVILFVVYFLGASWLIRVAAPSRLKQWSPHAVWGLLVVAAVVLGVRGAVPNPSAGKLAGPVGALESKWGPYPKRGSLEVMTRLGQISRATLALSGGEGEVRTVVFAESSLGVYDPTMFPAVKRDILSKIEKTGQTVVVGVDLEQGPGRLSKVALVLRPDGTSSYAASRQPIPVVEWSPWGRPTYAMNWLANSTVNVGSGVNARVMFCYEEYIPALHLISELQGDNHMVIAVANLWASNNPLTNFVQSAHTEGMARLFGRHWVRAVNFPKSPEK